jgi:large subunit ribosomal protein L24
MKIRKEDTVKIISGKDKGKSGKVRRVLPKQQRVIVDGLNMIKRHSRAKRGTRQAGIIELEGPIAVSNVKLMCPKCGNTARIGFNILDDGRKARICSSCREIID